MKRIDTATKAVDLYGAGKHGFQDGDPDISQAPTSLNASWFNQVQEELARILEGGGVALDSAKLNQIATLLGPLVFVAAGGTANALTVTLPAAIAPAAYVDQQRVRFKVAAANTGNVTINLNDLGARALVHDDDSEMLVGELRAGQFVEAIYDLTAGKFRLRGQTTRGRFRNMRIVTSSEVWTRPPGETEFYIRGQAAGGSAGAGNGSQPGLAGTNGGYFEGMVTITDPTVTITVGSPGAPTTTPGADGADAGNLTFGSYATANGGRGGVGGGSLSGRQNGGSATMAGGLALNGAAGGYDDQSKVEPADSRFGVGGRAPQGYGVGGLGGLGSGGAGLPAVLIMVW